MFTTIYLSMFLHESSTDTAITKKLAIFIGVTMCLSLVNSEELLQIMDSK